jgi:hypothetical protein
MLKIDWLHSDAQIPTGNETDSVIALHDLNNMESPVACDPALAGPN